MRNTLPHHDTAEFSLLEVSGTLFLSLKGTGIPAALMSGFAGRHTTGHFCPLLQYNKYNIQHK